MHNLYTIFVKFLDICKRIAGNIPRRGVIPQFSDLEVIVLSMASERRNLRKHRQSGTVHRRACIIMDIRCMRSVV